MNKIYSPKRSILSASLGSADPVEYFLEQKANPVQADAKNMTPMMQASTSGL